MRPRDLAAGSGRLNGVARTFDRAAIALSGLCLAHCLTFPLAVAFLPSAAAVLPPNRWVHPMLLAVALPLAALALWRGWQRHRDWRPPLLGGIGLALLAAGVLPDDGGWAETGLTVAGGLLLAGAHLLNWRRSAQAGRPPGAGDMDAPGRLH